ncbi:hypothetical protein [uncultured Jatrophihabitans sp.]|uniref:hypothetical protein n=1 Tax=uncultured Jatrophihabitans sp. TaxID=1610747 RepID=UPI0035CAF8A7
MRNEDPTAGERIEADRERAGESGDGLAQAVDRHRDELGMPPEPADGEDVHDSAEGGPGES